MATEQVTYHLDSFDGPLDLLLHLISKNKVSIYDIPIAQILEQYLDHLAHMKELDLEVTSEFVAMAAQLMYIKSKMLLPVYEEAEQGEDPRAQLVEALLEYQRYKEAGGQLAQRMELGRDLYTKPPEPLGPAAREYHYTTEVLARAVRTILDRYERKMPPPTALFSGVVGREPVPVSAKIQRILHLLAHYRQVDLEQLLLESQSRSEVVSVFLAVLELSKSRRLQIDGVAGGYILTLAGD